MLNHREKGGSAQSINTRLTRAANLLGKKETEGVKRSYSELEEDKYAGASEKGNGKRSKPETIRDRCAEIIAFNKINAKHLTDQYNKGVLKRGSDYVESKKRNKYLAVNAVGKDLFMENGTLGGEKKVTRRVFKTSHEALEEGIELISGKIAEGYQRPFKGKEYRIDYSKVMDEEDKRSNDSVVGGEEAGDGTDVILSEAVDDEYVKTIEDSLNDLEMRYGYK